jgi:type IV pilus assembly protein PilO
VEQQLKNLTFGRALIIGIVLAGIYYFTMYNDGSSFQTQINKAKDTRQQNEAEVARIARAVKDAERYQQTMAVRSAEMEGVLKAVPAQLSSFDLMKIVSNEAKLIGLQINGLTAAGNYRADNKDAIFEPVGVTVNLTGNYNQVMLFLSNLTKLDKIVTVKKMSFVSKIEVGKRNGAPTITFISDLSGYKYLGPPEEKEAAPAAAPAAAAKKDE